MLKKFKVLFAGDVGTGKTTAINSISDIPTVYTDVRASDIEDIGKTHTTVAFDYGEIHLAYLNNRLRLYGLPGQVRFSFIWDMLSDGVIGIVLLANNHRDNALHETEQFLQAFLPILQKEQVAMVLGLTHGDVSAHYKSKDYWKILQKFHINAPILSIDAREKNDVLLLLEALFSQIEATHRQTLHESKHSCT
ncbi:ATP/GTP-binding protein [Vitreoscilla massiliensis]|uniref:ATP/GTP-binding protein n=1 Tax=Vitreoscilla massiliensis TaxID=1689272 RepID=A0ABY4E0K7_9NEIS|nr:ATP/GTP-binding protein [Vitreoscilla massiliensis]UOO88804.1 ATP/GTP-binding protein [Vitreoscilla massiliensis]